MYLAMVISKSFVDFLAQIFSASQFTLKKVGKGRLGNQSSTTILRRNQFNIEKDNVGADCGLFDSGGDHLDDTIDSLHFYASYIC